MNKKPLLMIPGPVPINLEVRTAMTKEMISHRSKDFEKVYSDCQNGLQWAFNTENEVVFINGTGSAAMEAAVANTIGADDHVLCIINGKFGQKFAKIAKIYTDNVSTVSSEWGSPVDLQEIDEKLTDEISAVTLVHAETSSGILNPVNEVGKLVSDTNAVFIADCITSIGCEHVDIDRWGVDLAITAPQKALGAPPGISGLTVSQNAKNNIKTAGTPKYLDLEKHLSMAKKHQTPSTSPVQVFWGLQKALQNFREEGREERIARHNELADIMRKKAIELGLKLSPEPNKISQYTNAVTVLDVSSKVNSAKVIVEKMAEQGVLIRTGLGPQSEDTIRIGTMGSTGVPEIEKTMKALEIVLEDRNKNGG